MKPVPKIYVHYVLYLICHYIFRFSVLSFNIVVVMEKNTILASFIVVYSVIIFLVVVGNCMVATILIKRQLMHKNVSNWYLLSLVVARILIGLFIIPAQITGLFSAEYLEEPLCKLCHYVGHGSAVASAFSIMGIAITTYWKLVKGRDIIATKKHNMRAVLGIWVVAFVYACHAMVTNGLHVQTIDDEEIWMCTPDPKFMHVTRYLVLIDCVVLFIIPLIVVFYCYISVIKHLARQKLTHSGEKPRASVDCSVGLEYTETSAQHKDVTVQETNISARQVLIQIRMLIILMTLFTICTLAPMVIKIYVHWQEAMITNQRNIMIVLLQFSYSNAWYNIVVFYICKKDIRSGFHGIFCRGSSVADCSVADCSSDKIPSVTSTVHHRGSKDSLPQVKT